MTDLTAYTDIPNLAKFDTSHIDSTRAPVVLVDGSYYLFRCFFGLPPLSNKDGLPTNAIRGVLNALNKLMRRYKPAYMAVAFDTKAPTIYAGLMAAVALFSILLGIIGSAIVYRFGGVSFKTAWFASVIGGASEMSNFAQIHGARVDQVVAAHSLRVLMVVTIVPFFYKFMGYHGKLDALLSPSQTVHTFGLVVLIGLCVVMALVFERLKLSNPWTFAPLLTAACLTANDIHLSAMPNYLSYLGQICIGWTLGAKFRPDFFQTAPKLLTATAVSVIIHLILTVIISLSLAWLTGMDVSILGLGFAPGGVAEMTITAKTLQLGVPIVTILHVVRMVAVISTAGILYHWINQKFIHRHGVG